MEGRVGPPSRQLHLPLTAVSVKHECGAAVHLIIEEVTMDVAAD